MLTYRAFIGAYPARPRRPDLGAGLSKPIVAFSCDIAVLRAICPDLKAACWLKGRLEIRSESEAEAETSCERTCDLICVTLTMPEFDRSVSRLSPDVAWDTER
jgi:hypothetical protein